MQIRELVMNNYYNKLSSVPINTRIYCKNNNNNNIYIVGWISKCVVAAVNSGRSKEKGPVL